MLVCHCERVRCQVIRDCVQHGAQTPDEVGARCGAGTRCGGCLPLVEELIERELTSAGQLDGVPHAPEE